MTLADRDDPKYPPGNYLIRRHNAWFRPSAHGYTTQLHDVGIFPQEMAVTYLDVEGLTIHHVDTVVAMAEAEARRLLLEVAGIEGVILKMKEAR